MEASLPRACELLRLTAALKRLFGLDPRGRRRSGLSTAYDERRPGVNDLPPAASSPASPLRCEARDDALVIEPPFTAEVNIRGVTSDVTPYLRSFMVKRSNGQQIFPG
jgi:hypothetical protein